MYMVCFYDFCHDTVQLRWIPHTDSSDSCLLCLHPAPRARAQFFLLSYWLCCSVAPPTTERPEEATDRNKRIHVNLSFISFLQVYYYNKDLIILKPNVLFKKINTTLRCVY